MTYNLIFCHTTLEENFKKMDVQILNFKKRFPFSKIASQLRCMWWIIIMMETNIP